MSLFEVVELSKQKPLSIEQLDTHKASFRCDFSGSEEVDKKNLLMNKKVIFFISVGQAYHEKGKLLATIKLINQYPIAQCDLMLADTLQRHNFFGKLGEEKATFYSSQAGEAWLYRNQNIINQLVMPFSITKWDALLAHREYNHLKKLIVEEYHSNSSYQSSIKQNARCYIERLQKLNPDTSVDQLMRNSLNYLIEELPIVMPLWAQMGYDYIVYPKPMTVGMKMTYDLFVKNHYPEKCKWFYLRFKKRNQAGESLVRHAKNG